jgi:biotin carboxylase
VPGSTLALDFESVEDATTEILRASGSQPFRAVVGADEETVVLAAAVSHALGLRHNPPEAVRITRDKHALRSKMREAGLRTPGYRLLPADEPLGDVARAISYPCVLKPLHLSASRGVLRVDDAGSLESALHVVARILSRAKGAAGSILVEDYLPGEEVALEGLLEGGALRVLALFDKPDPLVGPTFEETIYVTPSRLPARIQAAIIDETTRACAAIGLVEGPIHAELRIHDEAPWMLEVAARSIGGLCSRTLRFGEGISQEELILRHALGMDTTELGRAAGASGVMMIPVPARGILRGVQGADAARETPGIEDVVITIPVGSEVVPLPEGNRYLGFLFARGATPDDVEDSLRTAHSRLRFDLEPRG